MLVHLIELFSISQGTLPWQSTKVVFRGPIFFVVLPLRNGLPYHNSNSDFKKLLHRINFSIVHCVQFWWHSVQNPRVYAVNNRAFLTIRQKSAYHVKYLRISLTYLDLLYRFGRRIGGDYYPDIRLAVTQGTLLWQPAKFGGCSQTSPGTTITLRFGIRQQIGRS